nr:hypothetical protein [Tanacetum cinerariifolium]
PFIINELLSWCKHKKINGMIFKVDFERAFDSVKWDYLDETLKAFGFGQKWCRWISSCLNNAMGLVLVNASGLKINLHKIKLMGIGVSLNVVESAATMIGCFLLSSPFKYLGVKMYRSNQQVNSVTPSCETCGDPHSYYECQAVGGYTQDVYATTRNYNSGGYTYQPQGNRNLLRKDLGVCCLATPFLNLERKSKQLPHGVVLPKSTARVPPPVVQPSPISRSFELPPSPASTSFVILERNPHQPPIPYPSRLNTKKLQHKSNIQVYKFLQIFKKLHFNISLAKALALMPKYAKMLKDLLLNKEKLLGLANTSLTKNCSAVRLKKLPKKLRDPEKFLTPYDFLEREKCMALADLAGIAKDVCVQVGKFTFPADFVVIDYDVNPRVPLILGRPFLRTTHALVDVYGEELILRDDDEKLIFHADSTSKYPHKHENESINMINFIDITYEDNFNKVLKIQKSFHPSFADELALLEPFLPGNKDDSSPKTDFDIIEPILERFTDEPALVYSFPQDDEDDDLFDFENDNDEWRNILYHDLFDDIQSEKDKIKDFKMKILIDEVESPESNVYFLNVEEPKKKRVADETLLQESFKKLRAAEVSSSKSTQEIPSNDPKEMSKKDVQNIEDLVALWNFVKEKFSSAVPSVDKEKALWVELKRLFEPDADDVLWKLQRYIHAPLTWKLSTDYGVHHVSSTRGHDVFMLTEKDYPLLNAVMILMLSGKLQVEEDNEMARDLVMKIFMEAKKLKIRIKKVNDAVQLRALINGQKVVVSEDIIRIDLYLDDAHGVECLPNEEIFEDLARMGYEKPPLKLTFYKAFFSAQWKFLIHTLV